MNITELAGELLAHADEQGTMAFYLKEIFMDLKQQAHDKTPLGMKVRGLLEALKNKTDPFYEDKEALEVMQLKQMAHTALKMVDLGASLDEE
jgi:hypothetical protein